MNRIPSLGPRGEGWVSMQLVAMAAVALTYGVSGEPSTGAAALGLRVIGWAALLLGGAMILWGYAALSRVRAFSVMPRPLAEGALVESGPFRLVRHPIYGGLVLGALGLAAIRSSMPTIVAALALFVVLDLKRRREEEWLVRQFPPYEAYRRRVRALVPYLY